MLGRFRSRSTELERLDTGDYTEEEYRLWQSEMRSIHSFLGEHWALRVSLLNDLKTFSGERLSILDVGAGSGEILEWLRDQLNPLPLVPVGVEINPIAAVKILAKGIHSIRSSAFSLPFADGSFDYAICTLALHHFTDDEAEWAIREMNRVAVRGIYIIDLRRAFLPYYAFRLFAGLRFQPLTVEDGSLSILRGFRPRELRILAEKAGMHTAKVKRSAFNRLILSGK